MQFSDDHAVLGGFPQYLEAALAVVLAQCGFDGLGFARIHTTSQPHVIATSRLLTRLAKVADEKRQTKQLGLNMLPSAIRAEAYSSRVIEIWKNGADLDSRLVGESLYLFTVNKTWHLSIIDSWRSSHQSSESFEFGLEDCQNHLSQLDKLCDRTGNQVRKATAVQAMGTVCLARAAHLNNLPEATYWYEEANRHLKQALSGLKDSVGEHHLLVASCCVELCNSTKIRSKRSAGLETDIPEMTRLSQVEQWRNPTYQLM